MLYVGLVYSVWCYYVVRCVVQCSKLRAACCVLRVACCMLQRELDGTTESVIDRLELSEFEKLERHFSQAAPICAHYSMQRTPCSLHCATYGILHGQDRAGPP